MSDRRWPAVALEGVSKTYGTGEVAVHALRGVDLVVERGDYVAIMGASGSRQVDADEHHRLPRRPDQRAATCSTGSTCSDLDDVELAYLRNRKIGFVFQSFNLIPRTSALRNVELPLIYARVGPAERRERALAALAAVGLADRACARRRSSPAASSSGSRSRARSSPIRALILADEPTGNLDSAAPAARSCRSSTDLNAAGRTIVMITHEHDVAAHALRMIHLGDGRIVSDERRARAPAAAGRSGRGPPLALGTLRLGEATA